MKKFLSLFMLFAFTCALTGCEEEVVTPTYPEVIEESAAEAYELIEDSVVYIKSSVEDDYDVGSGVVIKEDENNVYILTNKHVISTVASMYEEYYENIEVRFKNNTIVDATIVGSFAGIDVGVISVNKEDVTGSYTVATIENNVNVSDDVLVYGNPMEMPFVLSNGIVSALYSEVDFSSQGLGKYYAIQTDASINPGNSGGGLFNYDGELVGIVQGGVSTRNGLGYAIPVEYAYSVAVKLIESGEYSVSDYDFEYVDVRTQDYDTLGISETITKGMYVTSGEYEGKVIKSINGIEVESVGQFYMLKYLGDGNNTFVYLNLDGTVYQG